MSAKFVVSNMGMAQAPVALGPYCRGKVLDGGQSGVWGYSSGLTGRDPITSKLVSDCPGEQTTQVFENIRVLAEENGFTQDGHCIKNMLYITDMAHFPKINEAYIKFF